MASWSRRVTTISSPGFSSRPIARRHGERQRGHVRPEDDFVGAAVQEVGHGAAGFGDHGVGAAAGGVGSAGVGVVAAQVVGDGVDHALRDLRSAGAVEEGGGMAVDGLGERGELGADVGEVEGRLRRVQVDSVGRTCVEFYLEHGCSTVDELHFSGTRERLNDDGLCPCGSLGVAVDTRQGSRG